LAVGIRASCRAGPLDHPAGQGVRPAQKAVRFRNVALEQMGPHATGSHRRGAIDQIVQHDRFQSQVRAELTQHGNVTGAPSAETEIPAADEDARPADADHDLFQEVPRGRGGQRGIEFQHQATVEAAFAQQRNLLFGVVSNGGA